MSIEPITAGAQTRKVLTVISALCLVGVVALGVRSYWPCCAHYQGENDYYDVWLIQGNILIEWEEYTSMSPPIRLRRPRGWSVRHHGFFGLAGTNILPLFRTSIYPRSVDIYIPLLYPTVLFALLPLLWLLPFYRRDWRKKQGRCVRCGYLLIGLPERRCPECGDEF